MIEYGIDRPDIDIYGGVGPNQQTEEPSVTLVELLTLLHQGRRVIYATVLGMGTICAAAALLITPRFTSTASFVPPSSSSNSGASALAGQLSQMSMLSGGGLGGSLKSPSDLYVGILKSRTIRAELIHRFNLDQVYHVRKESQAEKVLAANSTFEVGVKDSIVTLSVSDASPSRARDLANAYLETLRDTNGRLALTESSQRRLFYGQQLAKEKDDLENAEVDLRKAQEQSGLIAPAGQTLSEIQTIAQTRAQIASRQVQLSALRQGATEQNPDVIRLQSEIGDLQGQLSHLQSGATANDPGAIPTSKVPALQLEYVRKTREVKYHEALFEMLARQYESARIDEAHEAPILQVLDAASYPDAKSGPPRMLIVLGGLIFGVLVGCGWVLLQQRIKAIYALVRLPEPAIER